MGLKQSQSTLISSCIPKGSPKSICPLFSAGIAAGFPSPAEDYVETALDLNEHLIQHPEATFLAYARGDSMVEAGIHDGDLLVVDRAITPKDGRVVVAVIDGEFTVKRLCVQNDRIILMPENPFYEPLFIHSYQDFEIWGVVIQVIHSL